MYHPMFVYVTGIGYVINVIFVLDETYETETTAASTAVQVHASEWGISSWDFT